MEGRVRQVRFLVRLECLRAGVVEAGRTRTEAGEAEERMSRKRMTAWEEAAVLHRPCAHPPRAAVGADMRVEQVRTLYFVQQSHLVTDAPSVVLERTVTAAVDCVAAVDVAMTLDAAHYETSAHS